jgi:hypothetical protein
MIADRRMSEYNGPHEQCGAGDGEMQATLEVPTVSTPAVSQDEAQRVANAYVAADIDPALEVVSGEQYVRERLGQAVWRFIIRGQQGPLSPIYVAAQTGNVIVLTSNEIRVIGEKAAILAARNQGVIPVDG